MLEKDLEQKLKRRCEEMDCLCLKFESPGNTGVPDRLVIGNHGNIYFVELKQSKKARVAAKQRWWSEKLKKRKFKSYFINDVEELEFFVSEVEKEETNHNEYGV